MTSSNRKHVRHYCVIIYVQRFYNNDKAKSQDRYRDGCSFDDIKTN